jgi:hypothetical protein
LLGFYFDTQTSCEDVRERARIKIADMEARITDLEKMKSALQALVDECGSRDGVCPILETLAETHEGGDIILLNFFRTQIKADSRRLTLSSHCSAFLVSSAFIRSYLRSIQGFGRTAAIRQRKLNCREETHEPARLLLF